MDICITLYIYKYAGILYECCKVGLLYMLIISNIIILKLGIIYATLKTFYTPASSSCSSSSSLKGSKTYFVIGNVNYQAKNTKLTPSR